MRIEQIGRFDEKGHAKGWVVTATPGEDQNTHFSDILTIDITGRVKFCGIEMVEWTNQRNEAMGLS